MQEIRQNSLNDRSAEVSGILGEYHRLFDIYHEYSGVNNLCTVNRLAGGESGLTVDKTLIELHALRPGADARLTNGEMDVTMGAVLSSLARLPGGGERRTPERAAKVPTVKRSLRPRPRSTPDLPSAGDRRGKHALCGSPTRKLRSTWAHLARATPTERAADFLEGGRRGGRRAERGRQHPHHRHQARRDRLGAPLSGTPTAARRTMP